jgi:hypothetical protein
LFFVSGKFPRHFNHSCFSWGTSGTLDQLKRELSSLGQAINVNALNDWELKVTEYLANLWAGVEA